MNSLPRTPGIYAIRNLTNGHLYIGSAVNMHRRKTLHIGQLKQGRHHSIVLQRAFNKYGEDAFVFEILEHVEVKENLIQREQHYIDLLNPVYNIALKAGSPMDGRKHSPETRKRLSLIHSNPRKPLSEVTKKRIGIANTGKKWTEEQRIALSASRTGKKRNGKPWSEESKKQLRENRKLPPKTPEHKAKLAEHMQRINQERKIARLNKEEAERIRNLQRHSEMTPIEPIDPSQYRSISLWEWNKDTSL